MHPIKTVVDYANELDAHYGPVYEVPACYVADKLHDTSLRGRQWLGPAPPFRNRRCLKCGVPVTLITAHIGQGAEVEVPAVPHTCAP